MLYLSLEEARCGDLGWGLVMRLLMRPSRRSADDRIGIRGALAVGVVVAVVAGSLTLATRLDPVLRKFAPNITVAFSF